MRWRTAFKTDSQSPNRQAFLDLILIVLLSCNQKGQCTKEVY